MAIVIGVVFLAFYARRVSMEINSMSDALLATQLALAREQKLTDLGGVVAAAAHELGTPLATIKLVSSELIDELEGHDTLREDAELIRDQADHCRDILRSMGRAGKDDLHMRQAPLDSVIREAAEPHRDRGKDIRFDVAPEAGADARQPQIWRRPEVIHGLRNLVQNAVDFSSTTVWIDARWTDDTVSIRIADDGQGFSTTVLGRIGDPFMRARKSAAERGKRPEYEGMGLGLFIAKTLLERSGAELGFANGADPFAPEADRPDRSGALVEVTWPRARIAAETQEGSRPLGQNRPIRVG
jgi:two-component system sensor histidine kinase RegB